MTDEQLVGAPLRRVGRRRRGLRCWEGLWTGLFYASVVWIVVLAVFKRFPLPFSSLGYAGVAGGLLVLGSIVRGFRTRETLGATARRLDQEFRSKERLSAALESSQGTVRADWRCLLIREAATCVRHLRWKERLPVQLPRAARWLVLISAVGAGLGWVPEHRSAAYLERHRVERNTRRTGGRSWRSSSGGRSVGGLLYCRQPRMRCGRWRPWGCA